MTESDLVDAIKNHGKEIAIAMSKAGLTVEEADCSLEKLGKLIRNNG